MAREKVSDTSFLFKITPEQLAHLRARATAEGVSIAEYLRRLIAKDMERG